MQVCNRCNGSGHDRTSKPEVKFKPYIDDEGKKRKKHITLKQGSGCLKCEGLGKI